MIPKNCDDSLLEKLSPVMLGGPRANAVKLLKRKNFVDLNWSPDSAGDDSNGCLSRTTKIFEDLQVYFTYFLST